MDDDEKKQLVHAVRLLARHGSEAADVIRAARDANEINADEISEAAAQLQELDGEDQD